VIITGVPRIVVPSPAKSVCMNPAQGIGRRDFLRLAGAGFKAATLPVALDTFAGNANAVSRRLSVQLYTIRDQLAKDAPGALRALADIGFRQVETAFWPKGMRLDKAAGLLRDHGLAVSSAHVELPLGQHREVFLDVARSFDVRDMIWHGWPEDKRYGSLEGTRELVRIYNEAHAFARDNGLRFGVHNHWWEFRNRVGGKLVYEVLSEELDQDVFFEIDTYWVKVAGQDPATIISRLGNRVRYMHIKDGPARWSEKLAEDNPDPMTPVGKGSLDFPGIIRSARDHAQCLVVEMDTVDMDVFEALRQSLNYMVRNGLAKP
jgi:sugar phosphate isomerase/epimerase